MNWNDLPLKSRISLLLRAKNDPIFFAESPWFLGLKLFKGRPGEPHELYTRWSSSSSSSLIIPSQYEVLQEFYRGGYSELLGIAGMRSGKTVLGSIIGARELFDLLTMEDPAKHYDLVPGAEIYIIVVASSEEQAVDTIFGSLRSRINNSPFFQSIPHYGETTITFPEQRVHVKYGGSNSSGLVGRTARCVIFDELARFKDNSGRYSAKAVYESLARSTETLPDAKRVSLTSPISWSDYVLGELYPRLKRTKTALVFHLPTWEFNPRKPIESFAEERKNPEAFMRDFGAIPSYSIETFFGEPDILVADPSRTNFFTSTGELSPYIQPKEVSYVLSGDPGEKNEAFGLALGHLENKSLIIDGLARYRPGRELNPLELSKLLLRLSETIHLRTLVLDRWTYMETVQALRQRGVDVIQHYVEKEDYEKLKELLHPPRTISVPDFPLLFTELQSLELHQGKKIDHPRDGTKDVSDAVANLVWYFYNKKAEKYVPPPMVVRI